MDRATRIVGTSHEVEVIHPSSETDQAIEQQTRLIRRARHVAAEPHG